MGAQVIYGKEVSASIHERMHQELLVLQEKTGTAPGLAVVLVGEDPSTLAHVLAKGKTGRHPGFRLQLVELAARAAEEDLREAVAELNVDDAVHGILVQMPLPPQLNAWEVLRAVSPEKDVSGLHPLNVGNLMNGSKSYLPWAAYACMVMLDYISCDPAGKHVVVIGDSGIVGKPLSLLMLRRHATVTVCRPETPDLQAICREADVLLAAEGPDGLVTGELVKPGAVVIDVGERTADGKVREIAAADSVCRQASRFFPAPGGVQSLSGTMVLLNTLEACKRKYRVR
ncbi:MAG TPA: bifunctional 5,10-methylene-tetrahydrofolate dehydrogenase/5,10-methylene-tetrahydrofolate cyclohydrolase [Firmicutes bacterium]|nr:bifunctional 5,10-methylene-tetrahydrofolate dehydrogenase/5,10-methylene-tetrahydrofolate cyclohydrolase [Bacillota bacterium]